MVAVMLHKTQPEARAKRWRKLAAEQAGTLLFETAGAGQSGTSYLFQNPVRALIAHDEASLLSLLQELSAALARGFFVAGLLHYEAGFAFERVRNRASTEGRLAWFGVYRQPEIAVTEARESASLLPEPLCLSMTTPLDEYLRRVAVIKRYIEAGDTYQVNLTTEMESSYRGSAFSLYKALAALQPAPFSALLHLPEDEFVLSLSPELLFAIDTARTITVRPMKGTASLTSSPAADIDRMAWLAADEKNRAEHLMIVDLLRSDLGRLCKPGSIHTDPLFSVERYRTLLQMTSTVSGALRPAVTLEDVFRALLPSGSMTGAPKPRTMEIIEELEGRRRGVYSGAIGFASPGGAAVFNVAIRTVVLKSGMLRMGVGGGIVADSVATEEHAECWLKSQFLVRASPPFDLVETLLWDKRYMRLDLHLARLQHSAEQMNFIYDSRRILEQLCMFARSFEEPTRVRMTLARSGAIHLTASRVVPWGARLNLRLAPERTWAQDSFLAHKTTFRPLYDRGLREAQHMQCDETIYANERDELTEGSISTLLVLRNDEWITPPLTSGVLPGVARSWLLRDTRIKEEVVTLDELASFLAVCLCNSVRGVGAVATITLPDGRTLYFDVEHDRPRLA